LHIGKNEEGKVSQKESKAVMKRAAENEEVPFLSGLDRCQP
jgi:hypothetical protein